MKKIILYTAMFLLTLVAQAQIKTPAPSPMQTLEQTVGLTDVTLKYSRPSVKGRTYLVAWFLLMPCGVLVQTKTL